MTLTDFLLARIAEDEAIARATGCENMPHWVVKSAFGYRDRFMVEDEHDGLVVREDDGAMSIELCSHIARFDPARVLAECEAKRQAIAAAWSDAERIDGEWGMCRSREEMSAGNDNPEVVRWWGAVYADHPDYDEAWRPERLRTSIR